MVFRHGLGDREAQADSFGLACHERLSEDVADRLRRPGAGVLHDEFDPAVGRRAREPNASATAGRLDAVEREIDQRRAERIGPSHERDPGGWFALEPHAGVVAARGGQVADRRDQVVDGHWAAGRLRGPAEREQAAHLFLDDRELPGGDREAVVDFARAARAPPGMDVDRQPGSRDGVAQFVGEAGGQLAEQPLSFAGDERRAERRECRAHAIDAGAEPVDLVSSAAVGKDFTELARRDPVDVPLDRRDAGRERSRGAKRQRHEHRERRHRHRQHRPDRVECRREGGRFGREHEYALRPHARRPGDADPISGAGEFDPAGLDRSGEFRAVRGGMLLGGQRGCTGLPRRRIPDHELAARQRMQRVEHRGRQDHARFGEGGGHPLLPLAGRRRRTKRRQPRGKCHVHEHACEDEPHHGQDQPGRERIVSRARAHATSVARGAVWFQ